jgi:hypothetical protein
MAFSQNETFPLVSAFFGHCHSAIATLGSVLQHMPPEAGEVAYILLSLPSDVPRRGGPQQTGAVMLPFFCLLLLQLMGLSLTVVMAVRQPSWRAAVLVGIAVSTCVGAGHQVSLQRITPGTLVGILGLDVLLLVQLQSLASRPVPRQRSGDAWWC